MAVMSWMGVMLKVCPKEAEASWEWFRGFSKTERDHQMLPDSP